MKNEGKYCNKEGIQAMEWGFEFQL
jgi:hypothetical protein